MPPVFSIVGLMIKNNLLLLPIIIGLRQYERHRLRVLDLALERIPESEATITNLIGGKNICCFNKNWTQF